jgi:hypothetical protein
MADLKSDDCIGPGARYKKLAGWLHEMAAPLSDEQFWAKPFPFGNSFGHLVLHLTGNLNYYIGAQIAGTGYVRDRPLEFSDATRPPKAEVLKKFDQAIEMVSRRDQQPDGGRLVEGIHGGGCRGPRPVRNRAAMRDASSSPHWADDVSGV